MDVVLFFICFTVSFWVGYYFGRWAAKLEMQKVGAALDRAIAVANQISADCEAMLRPKH